VDSTWLKENVLDKIPWTDAKKIEKAILDIDELTEGREKALADALAEQPKLREELERREREEFEAEQRAASGRRDELLAQLQKDNIDWWVKKEVPPNATPEQRKILEGHNKVVERLNAVYEASLYPQDAKARADVAVAAAMADRMVHVIASQEKMIIALRGQVSKLQKGGKIPNPQAPPAQRQQQRSKTGDDAIHDDPEKAIEAGLAEAEAAE